MDMQSGVGDILAHAREITDTAEASTPAAGATTNRIRGDMSRFDTLFSLRYAVRVLERQSRFWRHLDGGLRMSAVLSGSASLASLLTHQPYAVSVAVLGVFAVLQAVEFAVQPGLKAAEAWVARAPYLALLAGQAGLNDARLEEEYQAALMGDGVQAFESLRRIAYNDVVEEKGCDPSVAYVLGRWQRIMAALA